MKNSFVKLLMIAASVGMLPFAAWSAPDKDKAAIEAQLKSAFPQAEFKSFEDGPFPDLYQFVMDGDPMYVDRQGRYLISGVLYDLDKRTDLSRVWKEKLLAIDVATLPKDLAIKVVKGDGTRILWSFEDPNCGYCKKLQAEMGGLDNYTNYILPIPILSSDSRVKVTNIWCAPDRAKAYRDWMTDGISPPAAKDCTAPLDQLESLARDYKVAGTPTLVFQNGRRVGGYIPSADLERLLNTPAN